MNEILDNNFKEFYPKISTALKEASFIGIDCEFTGINHQSIPHATLFDSMQQHYDKLRRNIESYIAVQIGITAFKKLQHENVYIATPFSFYLQPKTIPTGVDREFRWQVTAIQFLKTHKFDFNKASYDGISYLNNQDEINLQNYLKKNEYADNGACLITLDEENFFFNTIDRVKKWIKNSPSNENTIEIECNDYIQFCCIQKYLRNSFNNIWTEPLDNKFLVIKVTQETRSILEEKDNNSLENKLMDYCMGFTKIFKLLKSLKKPIVGHNLLLDLMFMYQQFYEPLPVKYTNFKKEINQIYPTVYDTKVLSYEMKKITKKDTWKSNSLEGLYTYFKDDEGRFLVGNSPRIHFQNSEIINEKIFHDAGWDSFYTGYCFVKIAHVYASKKRGGVVAMKDFTHAELIASIQDYKNCVNLIRGNCPYMRLDGPDPISSRPPRLNFETRNSKSLNMIQVIDALSSFESVAIQPYTKTSVLIAPSNYRTAREILQHFEKNKNYCVSTFSPLKHSPVIRSLLWSSLVLSGSLLTWLIHQTVKKPTIT
ncbi:hypothetical protein HCN44_004564 [Aphidius gifuensis]|uniref:Uncharacterized protein n=1 Tax=Aphidius gifuensis TaxID=684658 RepID=A0A834Y194_APHGI|nr:pre-piRNA 3'-exonuclease trimmer-like [Aphidius gifuensis]KAF7995092.1 hypothetical protein HCN44_004564 [Aphidius gifuensis]